MKEDSVFPRLEKGVNAEKEIRVPWQGFVDMADDLAFKKDGGNPEDERKKLIRDTTANMREEYQKLLMLSIPVHGEGSYHDYRTDYLQSLANFTTAAAIRFAMLVDDMAPWEDTRS